MNILIALIQWTTWVVILWLIPLLVRNWFVFNVRIDFIDMKDFPLSYQKLPDYDSMLANPKYYLLWTTSHWQKWVERNVRS